MIDLQDDDSAVTTLNSNNWRTTMCDQTGMIETIIDGLNDAISVCYRG